MMAHNGRLLIVRFASDHIPKFPVNRALLKEYAIIGVLWHSWVAHEPQAFAANLEEMFGWYAEGKNRIETDIEYRLEDTRPC